ncbi:toll/interleukin-1 receptor (TIR) domain-containing protein [Artemisia annua]|uniref:Toll/interleukin-1 receptor (TIR) domain-containing protein n=1 Tax=Artemisia annua TaxID=35608 RepID=A0A2U1QHV3_ARTAN|nr:toll/interleukin-1 receptor (TIR) domain-containing protein [Artemisia annua]
MKFLELSYIDLEEDYKEIFLDVACILKGWWKNDVVIMLESCGFRVRIGLRVLELRSLINISERGKLGMHDHNEQMSKNIVRHVNPNKPKRHNQLWIDVEIVDILANHSASLFKAQVSPYLKKLRKGRNRLEKLHMPAECPKLVNLDHSIKGSETLHLGITPNLETLRLMDCTDMVEFHAR